MKRSHFLVLVVVLALLVAAGAGVVWRRQHQWQGEDARVGQPLVPGLIAANVGSILVRDAQGTVTLESKNGNWHVKERGGYPASISRIGEFLTKLVELKITEVEPFAENQRRRLDLLEPKAGVKQSGTVVELKDKKGKSIAKLLLGKQLVRQSVTTLPSKGPVGPSGRYVESNEPGSVLVVSDPLSLAQAKPKLWLDRDLIRVHGAKQMTSLVDGKVRWSVARKSESADWKSTLPGEKVDSEKVQDLVSALIYIALDDVAVDAQNAGFGGNPVLKVSTFDDLHYTLTFGGKKGDLRYLRISLEGNPPAARVPGPKETPEQKAKKDKEFEKSHEELLKQLAREKKLAGWTFLVRNSDVESLLRDRAQLAPEKKG